MVEMSHSPMMSRSEFCKVVGISLVTEWRLRQAGKLSHYKMGTKILYGTKHLEEFLASCEQSARKPQSALKRMRAKDGS